MIKKVLTKTLLLAAMLLPAIFVSCSGSDAASDLDPNEGGSKDSSIPAGYGKLQFTIVTPESAGTRADNGVTGQWLDATDEENINEYWVLIVDRNKNTILSKSHGKVTGKDSVKVISEPIQLGTYNLDIYAFSNLTNANLEQLGLNPNANNDLGATNRPNDLDTRAIRTAQSYYIGGTGFKVPMAGKQIGINGVEVVAGEITPVKQNSANVVVIMWRAMAKLEFDFTNKLGADFTSQDLKVTGIEVEKLNNGGNSDGTQDGIYCFPQVSDAVMKSSENLAAGGHPIKFNEPQNYQRVTLEGAANGLPLDLKGNDTKKSFVLYVHESDATVTELKNQYSLRFKMEGPMFTDNKVVRLGFTRQWSAGNQNPTTGEGLGFNVIRRNDWIKIPVSITPYSFRVEGSGYPPIAGYPARLVSNDGYNVTFNSGGLIELTPQLIKAGTSYFTDVTPAMIKNVKVEGGVTFIDPADVYGNKDIFAKMPYLLNDGTILAELKDTPPDTEGTATVALTVEVEGFTFRYYFNVIKQKNP